MKKMASILFLLASSCIARDGEYTFFINSDEEILINGVHNSAIFWREHDIVLEETNDVDSSDVVVQIDESLSEQEDILAYYSAGAVYVSMQVIQREVRTGESVGTSCLLSHEFGHFFGLEHVDESASMMYPVMYLCGENAQNIVCCWSESDQKELERVTQ